MEKLMRRFPRKDRRQSTPNIIGWREWLELPELGINCIKTKVDTGARTSALHAFNIEAYQQDGKEWVRFTLHPLQRNDQVEHTCSHPIQETRLVTNSGGAQERRFVITTPAKLGNQTWPIEVTLTNRDEMGFRMLLGRTALRGRFIIDPARSYCQGKPGDPAGTTCNPEQQPFWNDEEE